MSADQNGNIKCLNKRLDQEFWSTKVQSRDVSCKAVSSLCTCGTYIIAGICKVFHVVNVDTGASLVAVNFPSWINSCCGIDSKLSFVCAGDDGNLILYRLSPGNPDPHDNEVTKFSQVTGDLFGCALNSSCTICVTGGNDCVVYVVPVLSNTEKGVSFEVDSWVHSICFCPNDALVAATTKLGTAYIYDITNMAMLVQHEMHLNPSAGSWCSFATRHDDQKMYLLTASRNKLIHVWQCPNIANGKGKGDCRLEEMSIFQADGSFGSADGIGGEGCYDPESGCLVTGDQGGKLYALDII